MNEQLVQKIKQCPTLPSLPSLAVQVLELTQKENADITEIARIISKDAAMSGKILKTVNSSFYGRGQSVSTVSHALVILGLQSVKTLVLGFSLVPNLKQGGTSGFNHLTYWRRSIYAATAARTIAKKIGVVQQEECFLAALLKDIGMLVLDQVLGEEYGKICQSAATHLKLVEAEQTALQMTHAEVGGILTAQWKLPPILSTPITMHHASVGVKDPTLRKLTEVAYLAGRCADVFVDENAAEAINVVRQFAQASYNIGQADCDQMLEEIGDRTKEVAPLFEISLGGGKSFDDILKKANETLVELTLKTQQQATMLQVQNQELKTQATTDALTGLYNRAHFDQVLPALFTQARQQNRALALFMLDLDRFKLVNDINGHAAGDAVLAYVGKLLRAAAGEQNIAARYGGEEMVLIVPGATRGQAAAKAQTICRALAAKQVAVAKDKAIPVTVSIGVAVFEGGPTFQAPAHLLRAADLALYAAKNSGRNCVRVYSPTPAQVRKAA
jgi:diguanylate cyclase (GGDEF)-like protein